MDDEYDDDRHSQVRGALLKGLGVVVALGLVIAVGTALMVNALGLDEGDASGPVGATASDSPSSLPTTALPVPGERSASPGTDPSSPPPSKRAKAIELSASPLTAGPMERINLTGTDKGADNQPLEVQRLENGTWSNFGVQATVRVGTFATYIMTGRTGENRFRVLDPRTQKSSNVVVVTIG